MQSPSLQIALDWLDRHPEHYLFPIARGKKSPPCFPDNLAKASNDPARIKAWHARWPGCNWGLSLKKSGLVVADVDGKHGKTGEQTFDDLAMLYGWPETYKVESPSGGWHLYYRGEHVLALGSSGFGKDMDSPGYVLLPGSSITGVGHYKLVAD